MTAGALVVVSLVFAPPAAAAEASVTRPYVAATSIAVDGEPVAEQQFCVRSLVRRALPSVNSPDIGGACLSDAVAFPSPYQTVDLRVDDNIAQHVLARYTFTGIDFAPLASGMFCDTATGVAIPAEAWHIDVAVMSDIGNTAGCGLLTPTSGTITARFA